METRISIRPYPPTQHTPTHTHLVAARRKDEVTSEGLRNLYVLRDGVPEKIAVRTGVTDGEPVILVGKATFTDGQAVTLEEGK